MKYLNHLFEINNAYNFISVGSICLACNVSADDLFKNITSEDSDKLNKSSNLLNAQFEWLRNNTKCITEEEYMIKKLLE